MNEDEKKLKILERKYEELVKIQSQDKKTLKNKWRPSKLNSLHKKSLKKPEYVLVQYLRNNQTMNFQLSKVVSGNIIVVNNKGHKLNPKMMWRHGKYFWYIVGEWDTEPIGPKYLEKIRSLQRSTDNHPILMKMVLGAVQKKEELKNRAKIGWIIGLIAAGVILYMILSGGH